MADPNKTTAVKTPEEQQKAAHPDRTTPDGHLDTKNPQVAAERMAPPSAAPRTPHEAVQKGGEVPLPDGHPRNPPGAIPRAPGEWPSGAYPPEYPKGPMPAEEADKQAAEQKDAATKAIADAGKEDAGPTRKVADKK